MVLVCFAFEKTRHPYAVRTDPLPPLPVLIRTSVLKWKITLTYPSTCCKHALVKTTNPSLIEVFDCCGHTIFRDYFICDSVCVCVCVSVCVYLCVCTCVCAVSMCLCHSILLSAKTTNPSLTEVLWSHHLEGLLYM